MPDFCLIGHRGAAACYPENSREGFQRSAERGVAWVELDVRASRDGAPVVIHDASLRRTHGVCGRVGRWPSGRLVAAGVPRLEDVLADLAAARVGVYVEVKESSDDLLKQTLGAIRDTGVRAVLSSFDPGVVQRARAWVPATRTMVLFTRCPRDPVGSVRAVQADEVGVAWRSVKEGAVSAWRAAGVPVYAYTVNGVGAWERAQRMGLSGVFTDDPFDAV